MRLCKIFATNVHFIGYHRKVRGSFNSVTYSKLSIISERIIHETKFLFHLTLSRPHTVSSKINITEIVAENFANCKKSFVEPEKKEEDVSDHNLGNLLEPVAGGENVDDDNIID